MIPPIKDLRVRKVVKTDEERCESCSAKEGEEHPIEGLKVRLRRQNNIPEGKKLCQICLILESNESEENKNNKLIRLIKNFGSFKV